MPYKVTEEVIERTKYRAKMAIREAAHPIERPSHSIQWRWTGAIAMVAVVMVVVVGTFALVVKVKQLPHSTYMIKIIPAGNAAPSSIRKNSIANKKNIKVIWALSLPAKVAPLTSAEFIKETLYHVLKEL